MEILISETRQRLINGKIVLATLAKTFSTAAEG